MFLKFPDRTIGVRSKITIHGNGPSRGTGEPVSITDSLHRFDQGTGGLLGLGQFFHIQGDSDLCGCRCRGRGITPAGRIVKNGVPIPGNIAVIQIVSMTLHAIPAVAFFSGNSGRRYPNDNAGVYDLPALLEEYLIPKLGGLTEPAFSLVVIRAVRASRPQRTALTLGRLCLTRIFAVGHPVHPIHKDITPFKALFASVVISSRRKVTGIFCVIVTSRIGGRVIQVGITCFFFVAFFTLRPFRCFIDPRRP